MGPFIFLSGGGKPFKSIMYAITYFNYNKSNHKQLVPYPKPACNPPPDQTCPLPFS